MRVEKTCLREILHEGPESLINEIRFVRELLVIRQLHLISKIIIVRDGELPPPPPSLYLLKREDRNSMSRSLK